MTILPSAFRLPAGCVLVALLLTSCAATDPYEKPGNWRPMGANAMNLELQVAHPSDLAQGRGATYADGDTAAQAVDRLRKDKTKALMAPTTSSLSGGTTASGGGGS